MEYYEFWEQEYEKVIYYASTIQWLSLEKCINRELKKFQGLKSYSNPVSEYSLEFFQSSLESFTNFSKFLQRED